MIVHVSEALVGTEGLKLRGVAARMENEWDGVRREVK
jgi:hypothetical protein